MKVEIKNRQTGKILSPTTTIVFGEEGGVYFDPEILDVDGDTVIFMPNFLNFYNKEELGKAVAVATLTAEEAIKIAKYTTTHDVYINNKLYTRDRRGLFCAGFTKKRGYRTWLLPVSDEDAIGIIEKTKKIVYYTYNRGAKVVAA